MNVWPSLNCSVWFFFEPPRRLWRPICRLLLGVNCGTFLPGAMLRDNLGHHWFWSHPAYAPTAMSVLGKVRRLLMSPALLGVLCCPLHCHIIDLQGSQEQVHYTIRRLTKKAIGCCVHRNRERSLSLQMWERNEMNPTIGGKHRQAWYWQFIAGHAQHSVNQIFLTLSRELGRLRYREKAPIHRDRNTTPSKHRKFASAQEQVRWEELETNHWGMSQVFLKAILWAFKSPKCCFSCAPYWRLLGRVCPNSFRLLAEFRS